jgi:hypothetical protein
MALLAQERHKEAAVPLQQRWTFTRRCWEKTTPDGGSELTVVNPMELNSSKTSLGLPAQVERSATIPKESQDTKSATSGSWLSTIRRII